MTKENRLKSILKEIIYKLPAWTHAPISFMYLYFVEPVTIGPIRYLRFCNFLGRSQWWPRWKLGQYQTEKLKQLLRYAYNNVPYYTEIFKKINLTPEDIRSIQDLSKLPILTKEDVIKNFDKLISRKAHRKHLRLKQTSGSTGKPMLFYQDQRNYAKEYAHVQRYRDWIGVNMLDRCVRFWSRIFIEREIKDSYLYEPHLRKLTLSTLAITEDILGRYIELIKQFNPRYIIGNPSLLYRLACYAQERNITGIKIKCFLSYFENLFPYQRELIEKQFGCEIFNCYSIQELVISAIECSNHQGMHLEMEKGILEIIGEDGNVLSDGRMGKIIATGLHNYVMPLIRYDTGDIGSVLEKPCSCGRGLPLLQSLDGRTSEVLKFEGRNIYSFSLAMILWEFRNIKECQFVQTSEDELKVNIVTRKSYSENDTQQLIKTLKKLADKEINIDINIVDSILRSRMGKFPFIVSSL